MVKVLVSIIKCQLSSIKSRLKWFIRLSKANMGKRVNLNFPLKIEGPGKLSVGDDSTLNKNLILKTAQSASVLFGMNTEL